MLIQEPPTPIFPVRSLALALCLVPLSGCPTPSDMPAGDGAESGSSESGGVRTPGADDDNDNIDDSADADDDTTGGLTNAETGNADLTSGDATGDTTGGDTMRDNTTTDSTGSEPTCADEGGVCTFDFPEGWNGPVAMTTWDDGQVTPTCGGGYDTPVDLTLSHDLVAPPAACTCECGDASGGACDGAMTLYRTILANGNCFPLGAVEVGSLQLNTQVPVLESGIIGLAVNVDEATAYSGGSCEESDSESVPAAAFGGHVLLCEGAPLDGECDEDTLCMPSAQAPQQDAVCLWQEGDLACPVGWGYDERTLLHQGFEDDRECSECSCGSPGGDCTDGTVQFSGTSSAPGSPFNVAPATAPSWCSPVPVAAWTVGFGTWSGVEPTNDVGCDPSGGTPQGSAAPIDPVTVCCYDPDQ